MVDPEIDQNRQKGLRAVKLVETIELIDHAGYSETPEFAHVIGDIKNAVAAVVHPAGSDKFTINPGQLDGKWHGNGVVPIKDGFISYLSDCGWEMEYRPAARQGEATPGAFDCHYTFNGSDVRPFAVEWETGNISSSHRAINRIAVGIMNENISGGVLVVPSGAMKKIITDRIGNSPELEPYAKLWGQFKELTDKPYYLGIVVVEHDAESPDVPFIPKGTDGRALR